MPEEPQNANTIENLDTPSPNDCPSTEEPVLAAELQSALTEKTQKFNELNDKFLRLAAEFDNYKRLAQRDQRDQIRFANEDLIKELLPVVDNLERAITASRNGGSSDVLIQGVDLTLKQLTGALTKFHVVPVETIGRPFDPATHQAVVSIASQKVPELHVVDEFQRGYRLHDRILRAAMVSVSAGRDGGATGTDDTVNAS
jgi:molecular chaperone GrpE